MSSTVQTLIRTLVHPDAAYRPVQIIHCHYPKTPEQVADYLAKAKENGLGGFVANSSQLTDPIEGETAEQNRERSFFNYLGEGTEQTERAWRELKYFIEQALASGFQIWIYDELGYPSGAAGNKVLKDHPEYQVKGLICATETVSGGVGSIAGDEGDLLSAIAYPILENGCLDVTSPYPVTERDGRLYYDLPAGSFRVCGFYTRPLRFLTENKIPYSDLLRADVTDRFIEITHEAYRRHLGDELIGKITAFFTDEPCLPTHGCSSYFAERNAIAAYTEQISALIPELAGYAVDLFFDTNRDYAAFRRKYWGCVADLFAENYFGRIAAWCEKYGTRMTGHLYGEETLSMQIGLNADLFGLMRRMQMPGVDRLYCHEPRDITAEKTASSAAHFYGREFVMSENSFHLEYNFWSMPENCTAKNRLNSAYYQIQLGLTNISSYFGYSPAFDAERREFEERTARASAFCATGRHVAEILMLIPMTAARERFAVVDHKYWDVGPCTVAPHQPRSIQVLEALYGDSLLALQDRQMDFDLADEKALAQCKVENGRLCSDYEAFSLLILFDSGFFSPEVIDTVEAFLRSGGKLIVIDTDLPSDAIGSLADSYPDRIRRTAPEHLADTARALGIAPTISIGDAPQIRVKKTETEDAILYFLHNRTDSDVTVTVEEQGDFTVLTPAWNADPMALHSDGAFPLTVPAKDALMLVKEKIHEKQ